MSVGDLAEGLSPRELSTLSGYELGLELNQIDRDAAAFTDAAVKAQRELAKAEAQSLYDPSSLEARAQIKIQRALFTAAKLQLSQLMRRQSRIQTLLRTIPT